MSINSNKTIFPSSVTTAFKKVLPTGAAIALTLTMTPAVWAAKLADFVFVIDESGSMLGEHAWLRDMIEQLDRGLGSTDSRYGLVGFGNGYAHQTLGHEIQVGGGQFGTAEQFQEATLDLVTNGGFEDGYSAMDYALKNYSFRENAAINFVLVTDEDRDNGNNSLNYNNILSAFKEKNALLNAVVSNVFYDASYQRGIGVDSNGNALIADGAGGYTETTGGFAGWGSGTTKTDYVDLAWATGDDKVGGAAWDLNMLRAGGNSANSFTAAFVDIKVREVKNQKVPEHTPALSLLAFGALGAGCMLKRKRQQKNDDFGNS